MDFASQAFFSPIMLIVTGNLRPVAAPSLLVPSCVDALQRREEETEEEDSFSCCCPLVTLPMSHDLQPDLDFCGLFEEPMT